MARKPNHNTSKLVSYAGTAHVHAWVSRSITRSCGRCWSRRPTAPYNWKT